MHRRPQDYAFFKQHQPAVFKIMDGGPPDYAWARDNLPNSFVVARDWAMSEQHSDMLRDPIGTGQRHAREWDEHQRHLGFDRGKTYILGINEPQVWSAGVPEALRLYTIAMCDAATRLGLYVGAMQFSVGWPGNNGPDTPPDWSPWRGVEEAIQRNKGALVCHEYWADKGPGENWGWWGGRSLKCPWNVPIIIGECGLDMGVKSGSYEKQKRGWRANIDAGRYARELAEYTGRMSVDHRFVGCAVFAADFAAGEWFSFDIEPAYQAIMATPIPEPPIDPPTQPPPSSTGALVLPVKGVRTQRFGENPPNYARFGIPGHNGTDWGANAGTPVVATADGIVKMVDVDRDYGNYIRIFHPQHGFHSFYAHLLTLPSFAIGAQVKQGMPIGLVGSTGNSSGPHLHWEIRLGTEDAYSEGQFGYGKGRCDPETVLSVLNGGKP